ncbi:SRPBCC family protein [Pinibacter aurantiacus]|uniref:SRPBCC family protein n=1 Tax=Pinibacter aurantiacus TaxID=2851599 RepID=A0A9E2S992_9BACT|nr:SRPBCC family protein [Pinibacter aurantiacus]MBV4356270.1 SRPBCC family protein [Pinibacter aurantiacus]
MMEQVKEHASSTANREIRSVRVFNAPRELVFKVWTSPEHVAQWWGPSGFTLTTKKMEVRPGGVWDFIMHGPDGRDYPNYIKYREVKSPEKLAFDHGSGPDDTKGSFYVTVEFEEITKNKTQVTMNMLFQTAADRDFVVKEYNAVQGQKETMDRLEGYLTLLS